MLGTDKSRGYCLEMICADFLAGANLDNGHKVFQVPTGPRKKGVSGSLYRKGVVNEIQPKRPHLRLDPKLYEQLRHQVLRRDGWKCQSCGTMSNLEVHHKEFRSRSGCNARVPRG
jgi:hypothetical protein